MHYKRTHGHSTRMLVWYNLLLLVAITAINLRALHAKFLFRCLKTYKILKILDRVTKYTRVMCLHASSINRAVPYVRT